MNYQKIDDFGFSNNAPGINDIVWDLGSFLATFGLLCFISVALLRGRQMPIKHCVYYKL